MAFIFTMRSTPRDSANNSMHRRDNSAPSTLPAIDEDNVSFITSSTAPPVPPRALNRPPQRNFGLGYASSLDADGSPPPYDSRGEKLADFRKGLENNRHIAKRGGWKRLTVIALVLLLIIIGLVVGLVVGLNKRNTSSSDSNSSSSSTSSATDTNTDTTSGGASGTIPPPPNDPFSTPPNATFPIGSYSINTYLSTIATNCTSNPSTWQCYPFNTYAQSRNTSLATFDWIITSTSPPTTPPTYLISSTPNIFSIIFTNTPLTLRSAGTADEHYSFQLSMRKPTKPPGQLGAENVAATCSFDDTTMQGFLYTKKEKSMNGESGAFESWPSAVKIEQVAAARKGVPECVDTGGNNLGDFSVEDESQLCDCLYLNTGT